MRVFFDSSAFVKRFIEEHGSDEIEGYCQQASMLGLSIICFPEIISALNRKRRERTLSPADYSTIKTQLADDIRDADVINLSPAVIERSIFLLETNALRSLDSLHIACALEWQAECFISADKRQLQAAKKSGLRVHYVGAG